MRVKSNKTAKDILFKTEVPDNDNITSYEDLDTIFNTEIKAGGYKVKETVYRSSVVNDAAYGVYFLDVKSDFTPVLLWSNNYNRKTKAHTALGFYVNGTDGGNIIITNSLPIDVKQGTDVSADVAKLVEDVQDIEYVSNSMYKKMSKMYMTDESFGAIIGQLFMNDILKTEQLSTSKKESIKPSYNYSAPVESVWVKFNAILTSMVKTHPQNYLLNNLWVTGVFESYEPEVIVVEHNTISDSEEVTEVLSVVEDQEPTANVFASIPTTTQEEEAEVIDENQMSIQDQCEDMGMEPEIEISTVMPEAQEENDFTEEESEIEMNTEEATDEVILVEEEEDDSFTITDDTSDDDVEFDV